VPTRQDGHDLGVGEAPSVPSRALAGMGVMDPSAGPRCRSPQCGLETKGLVAVEGVVVHELRKGRLTGEVVHEVGDVRREAMRLGGCVGGHRTPPSAPPSAASVADAGARTAVGHQPNVTAQPPSHHAAIDGPVAVGEP